MSKNLIWRDNIIAQKMKFLMKNFSSKCDQIRSFLRIWSHLLRKSLMGNFIFWAVIYRWNQNCKNIDSFISMKALPWQALPQINQLFLNAYLSKWYKDSPVLIKLNWRKFQANKNTVHIYYSNSLNFITWISFYELRCTKRLSNCHLSICTIYV